METLSFGRIKSRICETAALACSSFPPAIEPLRSMTSARLSGAASCEPLASGAISSISRMRLVGTELEINPVSLFKFNCMVFMT